MGFAVTSRISPDESPATVDHALESMIKVRAAKPLTRTADVLVDVLVDAGVEVIFGLPGGPIAPIHDALLDRAEIRTVTTRHEAGALFAAAGYAQATGKLAVVIVTSGPGILNAMTGIANAFCEGLPVLVIAGEVPRGRHGQGAAQDGTSHGLDIVHMVRPISKLSAEITDASTAPALLKRAIATACSGRRGPAVLTLPMDVATAPGRPSVVDLGPTLSFGPSEAAIASAATSLRHAKRGLLLVGSGSRWGDGPRRVRELAERLQIPVMTTPKAKGVFPENHPLSLGVFGWGGHVSANDYLDAGVDVLFAIGTSLGEHASDSWSTKLAPTEHFIQLDVEAQRIGRSYPITLGIVDTVEAAIPKIMNALGGYRAQQPRAFGVVRKNTGDGFLVGDEGKIAPQRAIWELQRSLPENTLFTSDIGAHMFFALHHLEVRSPRGFMLTLSLGSMGSGIGSALGMAIAHPHVPVAAICGDGCFSMGLGDIATAAQERVGLVVAVLNDERYGMVEIGNNAVYGRTPSFALPMDIPKVAAGVGANAIVIEEPGQLLQLDLLDLAIDRPLVIDIRIDRTVHLSPSRLEFLKQMAQSAKSSN
jgi:acetolactate synthase-1/2/3 large subunit